MSDEPEWKKAMATLRHAASHEDKQALLALLDEEARAPRGLGQRLGLIWERMWPEVRLPAYGAGFAASLALVVAFSLFYVHAPIRAPEIDDLEFGGSSAVVIESTTDPTTLIWLSDADDSDDEPKAEEDI
jgi:hypothetical protein